MPFQLCDLIATLVQTAETTDLQAMMEETLIQRRCELALELLEKEKTVVKLKQVFNVNYSFATPRSSFRHDINKDVEKKIQEQHRKYLLNEQARFSLFQSQPISAESHQEGVGNRER